MARVVATYLATVWGPPIPVLLGILEERQLDPEVNENMLGEKYPINPMNQENPYGPDAPLLQGAQVGSQKDITPCKESTFSWDQGPGTSVGTLSVEKGQSRKERNPDKNRHEIHCIWYFQGFLGAISGVRNHPKDAVRRSNRCNPLRLVDHAGEKCEPRVRRREVPETWPAEEKKRKWRRPRAFFSRFRGKKASKHGFFQLAGFFW